MTRLDRAIAQVGLSPLLIQAEVAHFSENQQIERTLSVKNPGQAPIHVRMYAAPFTYDRMNGFVLLDEDSRGLSQDLTPHLQFSPLEFVLRPGEEQPVQVVGVLPIGSNETEYRAVILADASPENTSEYGVSAVTQTRIGSTIYLREAHSQPAFSIVSAQWNKEDHQAQLWVRNEGEATARANARWTIKQKGEVIASGQSGATTVMEGGDRLIPLPYFNEEGHKLLPGEYEISGELTWRFKATVSSQPFSAEFSVD